LPLHPVGEELAGVRRRSIHAREATGAGAEPGGAGPVGSPIAPPFRHPGGVTRRLVLASASPARRRVLQEAGFAPEVVVSGAPEDGVTGSTAEVAEALAERKATAVAATLDGEPAIVVGCDSVLDVDGETRGKPASLDQARAWWASVAGRSAVLHTGHCVI